MRQCMLGLLVAAVTGAACIAADRPSGSPVEVKAKLVRTIEVPASPGLRPDGRGFSNWLRDIAVDGKGRLYVADGGAPSKVFVFRRDGTVLGSVAPTGTSRRKTWLKSVSATGSKAAVQVYDEDADRIELFELDGTRRVRRITSFAAATYGTLGQLAVQERPSRIYAVRGPAQAVPFPLPQDPQPLVQLDQRTGALLKRWEGPSWGSVAIGAMDNVFVLHARQRGPQVIRRYSASARLLDEFEVPQPPGSLCQWAPGDPWVGTDLAVNQSLVAIAENGGTPSGRGCVTLVVLCDHSGHYRGVISRAVLGKSVESRHSTYAMFDAVEFDRDSNLYVLDRSGLRVFVFVLTSGTTDEGG